MQSAIDKKFIVKQRCAGDLCSCTGRYVSLTDKSVNCI